MHPAKEMNEKYGFGLGTCMKILAGRRLRADLAQATTLDEVKTVVLHLIDHTHPDLAKSHDERMAK